MNHLGTSKLPVPVQKKNNPCWKSSAIVNLRGSLAETSFDGKFVEENEEE